MNDQTGQAHPALIGQVALLTGGSQGLGRAYAQALAKAGATVAITARSEQGLAETVRMIEAQGGRAVALPLDVTDVNRVRQVVEQVQQQIRVLLIFWSTMQA